MIFRNLFLLHLACQHGKCYGTLLEVRGLLLGVSSPFTMWIPGLKFRSLGLALSHFIAPGTSDFKKDNGILIMCFIPVKMVGFVLRVRLWL